MVESGDKFELKIESLASSGFGVGNIFEGSKKIPLFVPYTVPGDVVVAKVNKIHKIYAEAELCSISHKSEHRILPVCEHFGVCGACDWLHVDYGMQIRSKEQMLKYFLDRQNLSYPEIKVIEAQEKLHYRDKTRIAVEWKKRHYGFYARKSNEIVAIKKCYIINDKFNPIFSQQPIGNKDEVCFAYDFKSNKVVSEFDNEICYYTYGKFEFAYLPETFVQSNLTMNKKLIDTVVSYSEGKNILDLYAGNGNFSLPLALKADKLTSVEGDNKIFELLTQNVEHNDMKNVGCVCSSVIEFLDKTTGNYDCIVLDPPRSGAGDCIELMAKMSDRIVYVSCDARVMVREIKNLLSAGFALKSITLLDMFPQTRHFETVALLERKK